MLYKVPCLFLVLFVTDLKHLLLLENYITHAHLPNIQFRQ